MVYMPAAVGKEQKPSEIAAYEMPPCTYDTFPMYIHTWYLLPFT